MNNCRLEKKLYYIFSDKTVAYLRMKDINPVDITVTIDTNKVCWWFNDDSLLHDVISQYKKDMVIQSYNTALRDTNKEIRKLIKK